MGLDKPTMLMQKIWKNEVTPVEWRRSVMTPFHKEKGDIQDCIELMSHTMEIWEKIIDQRLREETAIGEE